MASPELRRSLTLQGVSLDPQPDGAQEIRERLSDGGVIVDNKYDTGRVRHARVPSTIGKVK